MTTQPKGPLPRPEPSQLGAVVLPGLPGIQRLLELAGQAAPHLGRHRADEMLEQCMANIHPSPTTVSSETFGADTRPFSVWNDLFPADLFPYP